MTPAATTIAPPTPPSVTRTLTTNPFKEHILDYDYFSDDEYMSEDDMDDDDEEWADLEEEYERKEDEDVAVFRAIIDNLPIASLLHLLQGHIQAMQREGKLVTSVEVFQDKTSIKGEHQKQPEEIKKADKNFRWAEDDDNEYAVKSVINEIEPHKENPDMWFSGAELGAIRHDLVRQIKFFVRHHQERVEVLDKVIRGDDPVPVIEDSIKELTRHSIGRGLEGHISKLIPRTRKEHVFGVLTAQFDCACRMESYDATSEKLREISLINGEMMSLYAQRMAKSDEIEAMVAKMSRWEAEEAFA